MSLPIVSAFVILGTLIFSVFMHTAQAIGGQERIAYYGNWDIYGNGYYLKNVDTTGAASRLTTLVYSFENINPTSLQCFQTIKAAIANPVRSLRSE